MPSEKTQKSGPQPEWEQALRTRAFTKDHDVALFDQSLLAMQLKKELNLGSIEAVRKRILDSRAMAERELVASVQRDEFRALLVGAFAWWGLDGSEPTREQYVSYAKAARHKNPDTVAVNLNRRSFRETWAAFQYSQALSRSHEHELIRPKNYAEGRSKLRTQIQDAFVAFLYALIEGDDPLAYWDLDSNQLRRTPVRLEPAVIRPVEQFEPVPMRLLEAHPPVLDAEEAHPTDTQEVQDEPMASDPSALPVAEEPIAVPSSLPEPRIRRRRIGWLAAGAAAVIAAGIVAMNMYYLGDDQSLREVSLTAEDWAEIAGVPQTATPETQQWRYADMLAAIDQEHCSDVAQVDTEDGQELLSLWSWQDDSCLTSSLLFDSNETFGIWAVYQNRTGQQADDVTVWLELPEGFGLVEDSTNWSNSSNRNGNFTASNFENPGINLGSYSTNANFVVGAQVRVIDPRVACAEKQQPIRVHSISNLGRVDGTQPHTDVNYVTCANSEL